MTWRKARERKRKREDEIYAKGARSAVEQREDEQFAYHREAAYKAPWSGTDAYTFMEQLTWRGRPNGRGARTMGERAGTRTAGF
jgi:hypothetical protein